MPEARKTASVMMSLRNPTELDFSAANMAAEWARWSRDWRFYAAARELSSKPVPVQVGTFFNYAGVGAQEVASHFEWAEADGLSALLELFEAYCNPRRNVVLERYNFHARMQQPGESITSFLAALRSLAKTCEFPDMDNMLRDRLVMGVADPATQRALLRQADLTLTAAVDIAISEEASRRDQQRIGGVPAGEGPNPAAVSAVSRPAPATDAPKCRFCARSHVLQRSRCPAWGKSCNSCGGRNHFSACCRAAPPGQQRSDGRPAPSHGDVSPALGSAPAAGGRGGRRPATVRRPPWTAAGAGGGQGGRAGHGVTALEEEEPTVDQVGDETEDPVYAISALQEPDTGAQLPSRVFKTLTALSGESLRFLVDSGSECNVVSLSDYERVTGDVSHRYLLNCISALRMYDGTLVSTLGKANLRLMNPSIPSGLS